MARMLVFAFFILFTVGNAIAGTDMQCVKDCTALGNPREFCVPQCSFKDNSAQSQNSPTMPQGTKGQQIDPQCLNKCIGDGAPIQFCQQRCAN